MSHRQHAETSQFFRRVKHDGRETTRHFRVQSDLDTSLDLVLAFHQKIQQFLGVDDGFAEVSHQTDQRSVPFVHDLKTDERGTIREMSADMDGDDDRTDSSKSRAIECSSVGPAAKRATHRWI